MADRSAADERLGDRAHFDGCHHAGDHPLLLESVLEGQRVDHRRQHPHVVGGRAVHATGARRDAAKDVAAADHDGRLDAHVPESSATSRGDLRRDGRVDPVVLLAHERFAGQFQENALVGWDGKRASEADYRSTVVTARGQAQESSPTFSGRTA